MDNIRALLKEDLDKIEYNLKNFFISENEIFKDLNNFLNGSSKKIRTIISLLYLRANNVEIGENIIDLLSSGELIHNASLLHDDVIDNSETRRNKLALHKKYNEKIAILSGDFLLSLAVKNLLKIKNDSILRDFISVSQKMSKAEIEQYLNRGNDIDKEAYINIISGKTASLFEVILKSSAILANIDEKKALKFGGLFGKLFQINNDLKYDSQENDKANNLKTIVNILGIEKTNTLKDNYKEELREILSSFPENKYRSELENLVNKL